MTIVMFLVLYVLVLYLLLGLVGMNRRHEEVARRRTEPMVAAIVDRALHTRIRD